MDYQLYAVRVFTRDWQRACAFYRDTLGLTASFSNEDIGWAEFDVGGPSLAVERLEDDDEQLVGRFVGASLAVDDIQQTYRTLGARGVHFLGPPARQPWGGMLAHFEDPDHNVITLLGR